MVKRLLLAALSVAAAFAAQPATGVDLLVAGGTDMVIVDGNGNGPDAQDCRLRADVAMGTSFTMTPVQDGTTPILLCSGTFSGGLFSGTDYSSDYVGGIAQTTSVPGIPDLPLLGEFVDEQDAPDGLPVRIDDSRDYFEARDFDANQVLGRAYPCAAGAPVARVEIPGLSDLLIQLEIVSTGTGNFLRAPNLTFGRTNPPGSPVLLDIYVPLTPENHLAVALADAPEDLLLDIDMENLPACSRRVGAPTVSEWTLAALLLLLLLLGSRALRRRASFRNLLDAG